MKRTITKISFIAIMLCVVMLAVNCRKDDTSTTLTPPYKSSNPFVGNYYTIDTVTHADPISPFDYLVNTFNITITQNITDTTKIDIFNLNNTSLTITANVFNDSIEIPNQLFGSNTRIEGFGKRENNKLFYRYFYITNGGPTWLRPFPSL